MFSRMVADDTAASKKHKDGVAPLLKRAHLFMLSIVACLIALGQANAQFAQQGSKLVGTSSEGSVPLQGTAVSISSDGNTAIIGGYGDDNFVGAVWVWTRSAGVWSQQGSKLIGSDAVGSQIYQGQSVSLSSDGNTAIVGGWRDNSDTGAAWVWTRSDGIWTQQGSKLVGTNPGGKAQQGTAVALSSDGNTAIVGGSGDNGNVGAAWVWTRSGGIWTQQGTKLVGSNPGGSAQQGASVALSSDGNTAIVGGYFDQGGAGAVWVWTRSAGVWTQQGTKLVGTGAVNPARQGQSVSLSSDGNTAFVGGYTDNSQVGAAWVWTRSGVSWTQQGNKLVGTGVADFALQGISVSLSSDGNTAIVGGSRDNGFAGAVWVWTRSGGVWTQQGSKLVGTGAVGSAEQGLSVCLSSDGSTAIVGGYSDNSGEGAAWIYATPYPNPASVDLLTAGTYGALSYGGITGSANVNGDVGSSNSTVDAGITATGTNWTTVNNAHNLQAQTDLGLALSDALNRTADATIAADALGGQVLRRGVYERRSP
jgi:hypothetical protein